MIPTKIDKIVVVGGGSAGWMSAAFLIKAFPDKDITLVESPNHPIVGVGESTLGGIKAFCAFLDIDEKDFLTTTNGSLKMSIKFTDFYKKDGSSFHYPFGQPNLEGTYAGLRDWLYLKAIGGDEVPVQDFARCYFPAAALFEQNKFSLNEYGDFDNYNPKTDVAYHFDATKFGQWLKNNYSLPRGVKHILATVAEIPTNENGVECLILDSGERIAADLFIDATGWQSLLLAQTLQVPFNSYSHLLPNNKAWACQVPYLEKEKELEPFTNCTALENGWAWNIPLWSRLGTGYVFSDKFTTNEDALEQYKNYLCSDRMVIPRTREQIDELKYNLIEMRVGIHEKIWEKNVCAIGLAAGFIEPLESNGLFTVHEFLFALAKAMRREVVSQLEVDFFNFACVNLYKGFAFFVAQHYLLSTRTDTEYWRDASGKSFLDELKRFNDNTVSNQNHLFSAKYEHTQLSNIAGINYISAGMNFFVWDDVDTFLSFFYGGTSRPEMESVYFPRLQAKKRRWAMAAQFAPTLYEFLRDNIYTHE